MYLLPYHGEIKIIKNNIVPQIPPAVWDFTWDLAMAAHRHIIICDVWNGALPLCCSETFSHGHLWFGWRWHHTPLTLFTIFTTRPRQGRWSAGHFCWLQ